MRGHEAEAARPAPSGAPPYPDAMALEVGIVGLPNSGKTTLLTRSRAPARRSRRTPPSPTSRTSASQRSPTTGSTGSPRSSRRRRSRRRRFASSTSPEQAPAPRQPPPGRCDPRRPGRVLGRRDARRRPRDPQAGALVADRDQVERRHERVAKEAKSGDPAKRAELETLAGLLDHLDEGLALADWPGDTPAELDPLTTKPLLALENGPGGIDCKLEAELADLPESEAAEFRDGPSALDEVARRLSAALGLITFFTAGDKETRAWTLRAGQTALDAAGTIHTDIARGFIRCEVISADDLLAAGSHAEAARRGTQRLEGKTYVVQDGDVLNVRFNL